MLAEQTGGIAVVNQNDFDKALKRIDAETSDYYVLGYSSTNPDPLKRTRKIEVKLVNRPGVSVWSRTSYSLRQLPKSGAIGADASLTDESQGFLDALAQPGDRLRLQAGRTPAIRLRSGRSEMTRSRDVSMIAASPEHHDPTTARLRFKNRMIESAAMR